MDILYIEGDKQKTLEKAKNVKIKINNDIKKTLDTKRSGGKDTEEENNLNAETLDTKKSESEIVTLVCDDGELTEAHKKMVEPIVRKIRKLRLWTPGKVKPEMLLLSMMMENK